MSKRTWPLVGGSLTMGAALLLAGCPKAAPSTPSPTPGPGSSATTDYQPRDYFYPSSATQKNVTLITINTDLPPGVEDEVATASVTAEVTAYGANTAEVKTTSRFDATDPDTMTTVASSSVSTSSYTVEADGTVVVRMGPSTERYTKGVFTTSGAVISGEGSEQVRMSLLGGPESVQVPAGNFSALKFNVQTGGTHYTTWSAKSVGSVKTHTVSTFSVVVGTPPATASAVATSSTHYELITRTP